MEMDNEYWTAVTSTVSRPEQGLIIVLLTIRGNTAFPGKDPSRPFNSRFGVDPKDWVASRYPTYHGTGGIVDQRQQTLKSIPAYIDLHCFYRVNLPPMVGGRHYSTRKIWVSTRTREVAFCSQILDFVNALISHTDSQPPESGHKKATAKPKW